MQNSYDLHTWSKQYREEAHRRHLARRGTGRSTPAAHLVLMLALVAILLGVSGCASAASSDYDTDTYSVSTSASASASPGTSSSSSADADAARFAGMRSSSLECYTFYSDGTVDLRHGGTSAISDTGSYQGDEQLGEIVWDSGRWTSTVVAEGDGLIIDDLKFSPVTSCY